MATKIESIEQLKKQATRWCDCFISLHGNLRSRKHIWYDEESRLFEIINLIDGSEQLLNETEIMDKDLTNIGHAMMNDALYKND